jgi:hypothetical protein
VACRAYAQEHKLGVHRAFGAFPPGGGTVAVSLEKLTALLDERIARLRAQLDDLRVGR